MPSTLKKIEVTEVKTVDGKEVKTTVEKEDRFHIQLWMAEGYGEIEAKGYCHTCLIGPARGALPIQEDWTPILFTPSASLKAAIFKEVKAAVDAEVVK